MPSKSCARVVDRVDRDPGHADVALHPRVVGVVAAVRGQVERDAQALLAGGEVAPVERVGLLGGGEAGVLPDRPRLGRVHRRVGTAQERRQPRVGVERVESLEVAGRVERLDLDALGRRPGCDRRSLGGLETGSLVTLLAHRERQAGEALGNAHASFSLVRCRKSRASTPIAQLSSTVSVIEPVEIPATITQCCAGLAERRDELGTPRVVRLVGAGQADHPLAGVRRQDVLDALGPPGRDHVDAACREQVAGEGGARGVRRDRAHRGQEHPVGDRLVAEPLEGVAVGMYDERPVGVGPPLGKRLVEVGELGEPGQRPRALRDLRVPLGGDLLDAPGEGPVGERREDAPGLLDRAELRPARPGQVVGQLLDAERAAGRVGDLGDVGLGDQQRGGVAGDATAERVGQPERGVERQHGHRVRAADAGSERRDAGAQHVHPGVVLAHHRPRRDRVLALPPRPRGPRRRAPAPVPTAGARRAAWRWSGTARRSRRSGTPAAARPRSTSTPAASRTRR